MDDRPRRYRPTRYVPSRSAGAHVSVPDRLERPLRARDLVVAALVTIAIIVALGYVLDGVAWLCDPGYCR